MMSTRLQSVVAVILLLIVASIFRLYAFVPSVEFLGDQGRDALIAKRILIDHDPTLLGPPTSVGSMYLGPLYYYMMVPALALTYPSPLGPAYMISLLGILTVPLLFLIGKRMIGPFGAFFAALAYASAPVVVKLSRFSWQPNIAPFFGLIMIWSIYRAWQGWRWGWFWAVICFAVLIQSHYVALLSIGLIGLGGLQYLFGPGEMKTSLVTRIREMVKPLMLGVLVLLLSLSPLMVFDVRHSGLIREGFSRYLQERSERPSQPLQKRISQTLTETHGVGMRLTVELFGANKENRHLNSYLFTMLCLLSVIVFLHRTRTKGQQSRVATFLIGSVFGIILALSIYRDQLYDHYVAFAFPLLFLWFGLLIGWLGSWHRLARIVIGLGVVVLVGYHTSLASHWGERQSGILDVQELSQKILEVAPPCGKCNVAGLNNEKEYRAYKHRYFLEVGGMPLLDEYSYESLDFLIVIVENQEDPLVAPIYEIQRFVSEAGVPVLLQEIEYKHGIKAYIYAKEATNAVN